MKKNISLQVFCEKVRKRECLVGIIGLGYVGLPLLLRFAEESFLVMGFDSDPEKIEKLKSGQSYIRHLAAERIQAVRKNLVLTTDMKRLHEPDAILVCLPTPLNSSREPDLSYLKKAAENICSCLRPGQLISLESTSYPGTTREIFHSRFASSGLRAGQDYFLIYSPEREDPGNPAFSVSSIPKLVGGLTKKCTRAGLCLYGSIVQTVIPVSSPEVAEASKLLENIYRAVNIALVNELKLLFSRMGIDIWEVIAAARTKPFGFQAFYPGPGLGGHCIPVDPFYLTWKARQYDFHTSFIELAGEINSAMPYHVVERVIYGLNQIGRSIKKSRILLVGIAYKKDVDDIRESPAFKIWKILLNYGAKVHYFDPYVPRVLRTRQFERKVFSIKLNRKNLSRYDAAIIVTNHSHVDYQLIRSCVPLVVDTRHVFSRRYRNVISA